MSNEVKLYHGSQFIIKQPVYGEGNPRNDYGLGFYCTHDTTIRAEEECYQQSASHHAGQNGECPWLRNSGSDGV